MPPSNNEFQFQNVDSARRIAIGANPSLSPDAYRQQVELDAKEQEKVDTFESYGLGALDCLDGLRKGETVAIDDIIDAGAYFYKHNTEGRLPQNLRKEGSDEDRKKFLEDRETFFELISRPEVIIQLEKRVNECRKELFPIKDTNVFKEFLNDKELNVYFASQDLIDIALIANELSQRFSMTQDENNVSELPKNGSPLILLLTSLVRTPLTLDNIQSKWRNTIAANLEIIKSTTVESFFNLQYPGDRIASFIQELTASSGNNLRFLEQRLSLITHRYIWPNITINDIPNKIPEYKNGPQSIDMRDDLPVKNSMLANDILKAFPKIHDSVLERYLAVIQGILRQVEINESQELPSAELLSLLPLDINSKGNPNIPLWGNSKYINEIRNLLTRVLPERNESEIKYDPSI